MRTYLNVNLSQQKITQNTLSGEDLAKAGRHHIVKTLLERGTARIDPLSPDNPLIFSAGPFAGTNFSNANRISVGCKSSLTGGIKESNAGGTFAFAMGQLEIAGITLNGASDDWVVIRISKDGEIKFEPATDIMGVGLFKSASILHQRYGEKVSIGICGPVAEYGGLIAGIAFSDQENRPVRLSARGGVGAVMATKKVKAIVIDKHKMPNFSDRKKLMGSIREYGAKLSDDLAIASLGRNGTAQVADLINHMGGIPVRNFSGGQVVDPTKETLKMGGDFIRDQNIARGGDPTHACMPGCMIKCSNVYADANGNEVVSPLEYETIGLLGTNCGLTDPDEVAALNWIANDLGIDTIETGATIALLMEAGEAKFGDLSFMETALSDIRAGNERGRLLAQGAARVGEYYNLDRIPVIKKQAISAYDPRVVEVTGISMMLTAQGADHTAGNLFNYETKDKTTQELTEASMEVQALCGAADSLGLCVFGRSVTNINQDLIIDALNDALGTELDTSFYMQLGQETLEMETAFNEAAGFAEGDDELPEFFYSESLPPMNKLARHHAAEVNQYRRDWLRTHSS